MRPRSVRWRAVLAPSLLSAIVAGCHSAAPAPVVVTPPPAIPLQELSAPSTRTTVTTTVTSDTTKEIRVRVDTHGREVDVRDILTFLGEQAGLHFIFAPEVNKRIRVTLADVPLSEAILAVLTSAGLTLEGPGGGDPRPRIPSVVFYQVPVNVDSVSVDAIMKRFGVGREAAELVVAARRKP